MEISTLSLLISMYVCGLCLQLPQSSGSSLIFPTGRARAATEHTNANRHRKILSRSRRSDDTDDHDDNYDPNNYWKNRASPYEKAVKARMEEKLAHVDRVWGTKKPPNREYITRAPAIYYAATTHDYWITPKDPTGLRRTFLIILGVGFGLAAVLFTLCHCGAFKCLFIKINQWVGSPPMPAQEALLTTAPPVLVYPLNNQPNSHPNAPTSLPETFPLLTGLNKPPHHGGLPTYEEVAK